MTFHNGSVASIPNAGDTRTSAGQVLRHPRAARPGLVTPDEIGDPHELGIRTYVNDELRQDGNTSEMIYDCFQQVAHLSQAFTLEPGDVIATGTPAGIGAVRQPFPEGLLNVGDTVRVEVDRIGSLTNTVIEEPEGFVAEPTDAAAACALSVLS